jgi:hypothetical protein
MGRGSHGSWVSLSDPLSALGQMASVMCRLSDSHRQSRRTTADRFNEPFLNRSLLNRVLGNSGRRISTNRNKSMASPLLAGRQGASCHKEQGGSK